ncbi:reverse transcriptase [Phytophthora megakarya]|uniref:Reverse transcriptase n=1 Tax=Phytophthora megakarya TaxID=4795 RepID=A0A225VQ27_9STRA|nr:reverse transcriptase [Phytophthora megakarya]
MWGFQGKAETLSYWSVDSPEAGGVGILIFPEYHHSVSPWKDHLWTARRIGVTLGQLRVLNVYAPASNKPRREVFFTQLQDWDLTSTENLVLAGDFNCVEVPVLDRLGGLRQLKTESEVLTRNTRTWDILDARALMGSALSELELSPMEHFTYWQGNYASRIDRFYVASSCASWVQWVSVHLPRMPSDHEEVQLHLREPSAKPTRPHQLKVQYPIVGGNPERLVQEVLQELYGQAGSAEPDWDEWVEHCKSVIVKISRRDKQRRQGISQRLTRQLQENATTRQQLLTAFILKD